MPRPGGERPLTSRFQCKNFLVARVSGLTLLQKLTDCSSRCNDRFDWLSNHRALRARANRCRLVISRGPLIASIVRDNASIRSLTSSTKRGTIHGYPLEVLASIPPEICRRAGRCGDLRRSCVEQGSLGAGE